MNTHRISQVLMEEMQSLVGTQPYELVKANKLTIGDFVLEYLDVFGCSLAGTAWTCYAYQPRKDPRNLAGYPRFSPTNDGIAFFVDANGIDLEETIFLKDKVKFEGAA